MPLSKAEEELAAEIGVNAAIVFSKLNWWIDKGYGIEINGVVHIYNTYDKWQKQFPWLTVRSIQNIFKKLKDLGVVFRVKGRPGWDQTSFWCVNDSHPITKKFRNGLRKNFVPITKKFRNVNSTYPSQREQQNLQPVSTFGVKKDTEPRARTKQNYREKYPEAEAWLEEKDSRFRQGVEEYISYHVNSPKVKFPQAYKMAVIVEIWKKYTGQNHHTDFEYVDRSEVKPSNVPVITVSARRNTQEEFDLEMQSLLEEGELQWQRS